MQNKVDLNVSFLERLTQALSSISQEEPKVKIGTGANDNFKTAPGMRGEE